MPPYLSRVGSESIIYIMNMIPIFLPCNLLNFIVIIILIMDIGLVNGSPVGVMFLPKLPPPEPEGKESFPEDLTHEFIRWINSAEGRNKKLLTPKRRSDYKYYLSNPTKKSEHHDPKERQRQAKEKHHVLKQFEILDGQVYCMPELVEGKERPHRYCACDYDAVEIITRIHRILLHASR